MKKYRILIAAVAFCAFTFFLSEQGISSPCNEQIPDKCTRKRETVVLPGGTAILDCSKKGSNCEIPRVSYY